MKEKSRERVILGIDPGTSVLGYGIIEEAPAQLKLMTLGVVKLSHLDDQPLKLKRIFEKTMMLVEQYQPDCLSVEAPFYGKNIQAMLKLVRAQGVVMAAALSRDIPIFEYAPRKIKQSITGNGNASKEQVAAMLKTLLHFQEDAEFLDATDGLAAAVCHSFQKIDTIGNKKSYSGWEAFVKENAKRIQPAMNTRKRLG